MQKILVADDCGDLLEVLSMLFTMHNYQVEVAINEQQLLKHLQQFQPQLILLDVMFGGADGRALCKQIKQNNGGVSIILLSAAADLLVHFKDCNADDCIEKPFDISCVIDKVKLLLR